MKHHKTIILGIFASLGMLFLILCNKIAYTGAKEGVLLCLNTLIPSLFPFLVLSVIINRTFVGKRIPFLYPIRKLCGIPNGAESILFLGLLGGYPVGAQSIADAYHGGYFSKETAQRLLGFCNNAGPSFIFGIITLQFQTSNVAWYIWVIHILSALIVGVILPKKDNSSYHSVKTIPVSPPTFPKALEAGIKIMAKICGWVILFRVLLAVFKKWLFSHFPIWLQILITGAMEIANGCVDLHHIPTEGLRFILAVCILAIGGICVCMQTLSVTGSLGLGAYFPGKVLQGIISFFLAEHLQYIIFPSEHIISVPAPLSFSLLLFALVPVTIIFHPYIKTRTNKVIGNMLDFHQNVRYSKENYLK